MKTAFIFCCILVLMIISTYAAFAAFDDIGIGARPLGMGGAFVAIADDANAAAYNPAGLGYIKTVEGGFTYVRMFSGVANYSYLSFIIPSGRLGSFGANFGILGEESKIYSEKNIGLSYSKSIINKLSLGASFKMLSTGFKLDEINTYFSETSTSSYTIDVGLLAKPVAGLNIGLSGENLIPADISISKSDKEKVPVNLRFGLAYKLSAIAASAQQPALKEVLNTTSISLEGALRKEREVNAVKVRVGIEAWFAKQMIGLRAGYNMKKVKDSSSSAAAGGSIRIPIASLNLRLDYAMQIFGGDIQDKLVHRISIVTSL